MIKLIFSYSYNYTISGTSGNITVNGTLTYNATSLTTLSKRGIGAGKQTGVDLNTPPYAIHNGNLSMRHSSFFV